MLWNFTFASSFPFSHMFVFIVVAGMSQSTGQLSICWFWPPWKEDVYVLSYQKFFRGITAYFPLSWIFDTNQSNIRLSAHVLWHAKLLFSVADGWHSEVAGRIQNPSNLIEELYHETHKENHQEDHQDCYQHYHCKQQNQKKSQQNHVSDRRQDMYNFLVKNKNMYPYVRLPLSLLNPYISVCSLFFLVWALKIDCFALKLMRK